MINVYELKQKAEVLFKDGKFIDAIKVYDEIIVSYPDYKDHYIHIANCYKALKDDINADKYYNLSVTATKIYYYDTKLILNSIAYFYNKGDFETAFKEAEFTLKNMYYYIPLEFNKYYLYCLEKLNKKDELIEKLTPFYKINPTITYFKDLYEKYKNDIEEFLINYRKDHSYEESLFNAFKYYKQPQIQNELDYLLQITDDYIPSANYYVYDYITAGILNNHIYPDDELFKRYVKMNKTKEDEYHKKHKNSEYNYTVYYLEKPFERYFEYTKESYLHFEKMLINFGFGEFAFTQFMFINNTANESVLNLIKELCYPKFKAELKNTYIFLGNKLEGAKFLLNLDKKYFGEYIEKETMKVFNYEYFQIVNVINDEKYLKKYITTNLPDIFNLYPYQGKFTEEEITDFTEFFKTGVFGEKSKKIIEYFNKLIYDNYYGFYGVFIKNLSNYIETDFYKLLFKASMILVPKFTLTDLFIKYKDNPKKDEIENIINKFNVDITSIYDMLISYSSYINYDSLIKYFLDRNFDEFTTYINTKNTTVILNFIRIFESYGVEKTYNLLLNYVNLNSKEISKKLYYIFKNYKEGYNDYVNLTSNAKKEIKELGIKILINYPSKHTDDLLLQIQNKEKKQEIKDLLNEYFEFKSFLNSGKITQEEYNIILNFNEKTKEEKLGAFKKIDIKTLPKLYYSYNKKELDLKSVQYLLKLSSQNENIQFNKHLKVLATLITKDSKKEFVKEFYSRWDKQNKTRWFLNMIVHFGDDDNIEEIKKDIDDFIKAKRYLVAANIVEAISLLNTKKAFQTVDYLQYKAKSGMVKKRAAEAINKAIIELGITKDDFLDNLIQNYGFDSNGEYFVNFEDKKYIIKTDLNLNLKIKDENNKEYKSLPKAKTDNDKIEEKKFNKIKKDIKLQIQLQTIRFENNFYFARVWNLSKFKEIFVDNVIMKKFATSFIWGIYENDKPINTFRYNEDGTFVNENDDEIKLSENAKIGIIHPVEIEEQLLNKWKEQLKDYEIIQPFNQLERLCKTFDFTKKIPLIALKTGLKNYNFEMNFTSKGFIFEKIFEYEKIKVKINYIENGIDEVTIDKILFFKENIELTIENIPKRLLSEVHYYVNKTKA